MEIYGIEKNFMDSVDKEYSYLADMVHDPYKIGKYYKDEEIAELLYDI